MKRLVFNTRTEAGDLVEQKGYAFELRRYAPLQFALYKSKCPINSNIRWVVVELSSGFAVGGNRWDRGQTQKAAIAEAVEILDRYGKAEVMAHVDTALKKHAISGRAN